ncbi:hypothetical protein [Prolixibacter bellariivorans]|uniref:hypothetical protein n=1 Tax=Prolixibacter bellariivorans TaxID=314319 RepID=UPI0009DD448D|nr:hypothetical protein [Prolixibacter bellariivorans]
MKKKENSDNCICVVCDVRIPHQCGTPCRDVKCPKCGRSMLKEGSYHHQLYLSKFIQNKDDSEK